MDELAAARAREGEKLKLILLERLARIRRLAAEVVPRIPALLIAFQEKLKARLCEAMINCDDDRMRQELTLFASKIDVDEELSRLQTHLDEVERVLHKGGAIGKRLDFLMQELNREANTHRIKVSGRRSVENVRRAESADRTDAGAGAKS